MTHDHHCPHCLSCIANSSAAAFPATPMRCPTCRLMIGAGRTKSPAEIAGAGRSAAAAVGVLASDARRADAVAGDPGAILDDLARVAAAGGARLERLRMTDYDAAQRDGAVVHPLAVVLATFGSWKGARADAVVRREAGRDGAVARQERVA